MMDRKKVFELDKICRVCTSERREMRPLFSEKVAEMLMDCTSVRVEPIEGWPDKICVQCVHAVSRNFAFKMLVERSDKELREYIKSLTVQVVIDEPNLKTQQQNKLNQQQKQQKLLQKQIKEQQQQIEEQKQKLQQQEELIQHQNQQLAQPIVVVQQPAKKLKPLAKKPLYPAKKHTDIQEHQQNLQQQQPGLQQSAIQLQHHQQQQQQHHHQQLQQQQQQRYLSTQMTTLATATPPTPTTSATLQTQLPPQLLPSTTALPQQILLQNGQFITTAQIVSHPGTPQLAQIISTNPQPTVTATADAQVTATPTISAQQAQFLPHLLPNGQTLQIVQQANGTQMLQLLPLMPQRNHTTASESGLTNTMLTQTDVQLIDEADEDDLNEVYDSMGNKARQGIETVVLDDEALQQQQLHQELIKENSHVINEEDLTQNDTQELEFFEDMDSAQSHHVEDEMPEQLLHNECDEEDDDDDDFIIEEIQMDEEMLDEEAESNSVIHVMDANTVAELTAHEDCEYITDDNQPSGVHHLGDEGDGDVDELDYTILDAGDDETVGGEHTIIEDVDVNEVLHVPDELKTSNDILTLNSTVLELVDNTAPSNSNSPTKKVRRSNNNEVNNGNGVAGSANRVAAANSRKLAATASVIAAVGSDDNCEIDAKLVTEFIRRQTSPLGSGRYICNLCNTEFRQFKGLQNHMHSHTNWIRANCKKQPQCEICLKSFKGPGMLRMHMKTHDAESVAPTCNICHKSFKSKAILYRHRHTHQHRAYSCGVVNCRKTFSNASNLRGHIERKHPESTDANYKCGECNSVFDDVDSLQSHVDYTGHGLADGMGGGSSGGIGVVDSGSVDLSDVVAEAAHTIGNVTDTTVVMGTSGEVFFVTQA